MSKISANYLKDLSAIFNELPEPDSTRAKATQARTKSAALVLEAEAGERAEAYFVVAARHGPAAPGRPRGRDVRNRCRPSRLGARTCRFLQSLVCPNHGLFLELSSLLHYSLDYRTIPRRALGHRSRLQTGPTAVAGKDVGTR